MTFLYDGDCDVCTRWARWAERGIRPGAVTMRPGQGLDAVWWVDGVRRERGHRAIGRLLLASRGWRRAAGALLLAPGVGLVAGPAYAWVSRHRGLVGRATRWRR